MPLQQGAHNAAAPLPIRKAHPIDRSALETRRLAPLRTPTGISDEDRSSIGGALTLLLADVFALYLKTKNFHWLRLGSTRRKGGSGSCSKALRPEPVTATPAAIAMANIVGKLSPTGG